MVNFDEKFRNVYFALRHGTSIPNLNHTIISSPQCGISAENGLAEEGKKQAEQLDLTPVLIQANAVQKIYIISSDFSRAYQTALIVHQQLFNSNLIQKNQSLLCESVLKREELRERFFGTFEGTSSDHYELVWKEDAKDAHHEMNQVESVYHVAQRVQQLVNELESVYDNCVFILVSHGDTLQIMQAHCFSNNNHPISQHRTLRHLNTCELRLLNH